jgi:O-antigen ligase
MEPVMRYCDVTNPVSRVAFFWGLMAFMPVGMNYLGLFMLFSAVLWRQDVKTRWLRLWASMMGPALLLFAGWTLLVLVLQPSWYVQSASNLWHGTRIFLTIALAASLCKNEARAALQGFMLSSSCVVVLILAYKFGLLDSYPYWQHLLEPGTNKSIGASILLCMFVAILVASALSSSGRSRWLLLLVALVVMVILVETLSKRTGIVACILALVCVTLHLWRKYKWRWALAVVALALSCALLWITSPGLQAQFVQGIREVKEGLSGIVKVESWNVRIQMVKHTLDMMAERPLLGWGIGAWNNQWQARVPFEIAGFNMPHNDFLWMGAQAGWPGAVLWLALMLSGLGLAWKTQGWKGAAATACILIACFSALVNNGTRDATIGLPILLVTGLLISFARPDISSD